MRWPSCAEGWRGNGECPKRASCNCPIGTLSTPDRIETPEPLEEPFVPGMWFEQNGHRWVKGGAGHPEGQEWYSSSAAEFLSERAVRALGVTVHKPETPGVMVKCHVPDGKYLGQELPEHMKGKDLRVIPESAIVEENVVANGATILSDVQPGDTVLVIRGGNES